MKENWSFKYAGIELPPPDEGGITIELQPIDNAERNADGDLMIEEVALKRKITASWGKLDGEEANSIMSALINNRSGSLTYFDVSKNALATLSVYYGAGVKVGFNRYDGNLKAHKYESLSVSFIEM